MRRSHTCGLRSRPSPDLLQLRLTLAGVLLQKGKFAEGGDGGAYCGENGSGKCGSASHVGEDSEPRSGR